MSATARSIGQVDKLSLRNSVVESRRLDVTGLVVPQKTSGREPCTRVRRDSLRLLVKAMLSSPLKIQTCNKNNFATYTIVLVSSLTTKLMEYKNNN